MAANTKTQGPDLTIHVQVDPDLNSVGAPVSLLYANPAPGVMPSSVMTIGGRAGVKLVLKPMHVKVFTVT